MKQYCQNLYNELHELGNLHSEFTMAYTECEAAKDFASLKKQKDDLKNGISDLIQNLPHFAGLKRTIRYLNCSADPEINKKMKEKLLALINKDSYDKAVAVATELDPKVVLPKRTTIIKKLLALGPERLKKIVQIMKEPGLIIVPRKSLKELNKAMDALQHVKPHELPKNHRWSHGTKKTNVCIVDMEPLPEFPPVKGIGEQNNGEKLSSYERYFQENGLSVVTDRQYAVAMQYLLNRNESTIKEGENDEEKYIMDTFGTTLFHQESDSKNTEIGGGSYFMGIEFHLKSPTSYALADHSRAAITLIK